jgi:hypothetical protein
VQYPAGFGGGLSAIPGLHPPANLVPHEEIFLANNFAQGRDGIPHNAIDIYGAFGLRIVAATSGWVVHWWRFQGEWRAGVGWGERSGFFARIIDPHGFLHQYAHLLEWPKLRPGQWLNAGDAVGSLGNTREGSFRRGEFSFTGSGTVAHLHYQVKLPTPVPQHNRGTMQVGECYFDTLGRGFVNPYEALRRLAENGHGARRHRNGYRIPIPHAVTRP